MSFTGSGVWVRYVRHAVTKSVPLLVFASSNQSGVRLILLERVWIGFVSLPRSLVLVFFRIILSVHCQFDAIVEEVEVLLKWPEFVMLGVMMLSWCFISNVPPWSPVSFLAFIIWNWMHFLSIGTVSISPWKMRNPDEDFIQSYDSIVPDISELVNYNIGLQEVLSREWHGCGATRWISGGCPVWHTRVQSQTHTRMEMYCNAVIFQIGLWLVDRIWNSSSSFNGGTFAI